MKFNLLLLSLLCLGLASCGIKNKKSDGDVSETTQKNVATKGALMYGVYLGTIPGADCSILVKLTLNEDNSYEMLQTYQKDEDHEFLDKGTYSVEDNIITLNNCDDVLPRYFSFDGMQLDMLTGDKEKVTGELADHYRLNFIQICQ